MRKTTDNIVISDVRFPNEIAAIHNAGGLVIRIKRGQDPEWFKYAEHYNRGPNGNMDWSISKTRLMKANVHASEYSWVGGKIDHIVINDTTIDELFKQLESIINDQALNLPDAT
jgi:hypothetical protein